MKKIARKIPVTLTIAGSDNSGGAGIQTDLKTFGNLGTYGTTAITCIVAEHPGRVKSIHPIPVKNVEDQLELVHEAFPVAAMKTGMLFSTEIIHSVAHILKSKSRRKLVVDPVMVATSGALLLEKSAVLALRERILPLATVVTPNLDEAGILVGRKLTTLDDARQAAVDCSLEWGVPFLVKGGHLKLSDSVDFLAVGKRVTTFRAKTVPNVKLHGTGCTYSAAICAYLAHGFPLEEALRKAKAFITKAIQTHFRVGRYDALNQIGR